MKKLLFLFTAISLAFSGCAHIPRQVSYQGAGQGYVELSGFCRDNGLVSEFNTIDDVIKLDCPGKNIRMLLNSNLVFFNGRFFSLKSPPVYYNGRIFVPKETESIVRKKVTRTFTAALIKNVVIDPGHGGKDPGAISPGGIREKDVNLSVSRMLKKELEKQGFNVYLTRNTDVFLSLRRRVQIAKEKRADLFISVHANANRSRRVNGVEVYYFSPGYSNRRNSLAKVARKYLPLDLAERDTAELRKMARDIVHMENNVISAEASSVMVNVFKRLGFKVKPPRGARFYVLRNNSIPSMLVEIGYLTNRKEEKLLRDTGYRKQVAQAIALGVSSLNQQYQKLVKGYDK